MNGRISDKICELKMGGSTYTRVSRKIIFYYIIDEYEFRDKSGDWSFPCD